MNKFLFRNIAVFIIMLFIISVATVSVSYAVTYTNSKGSITVTCGTYKKKFTAKKHGKNFSKALNAALETARKKGKTDKIATVKLSKGNYTLDRTIKIYSNTTLNAKNCRIRYYGNLLRNGYKGRAGSATGYSGAKNITINGGTWDAMVPYSQAGTSNWRIQHSTLRFGHCKNVVIKNCTFVGNYNCHDIEFGAVKDSKITKCSFSNTKAVNTFKNDGGREAIQLDVATSEAMPEFVSYDKTPTKNITVSYCTFKNKFRGIGSHHAVPGKLFNNILVHHNTFTNIGGIAVYGVYWTNSKVYSNTMTNVGLGVDIRTMTIGDGYNFRNMDSLTYEQCEAKVKKSTLYIYDNKIKLRVKNNNYVRPTGIRVMGEQYNDYDLKTGIKPGTYRVYNVHIGENASGTSKPNTITGNVACGIQLNYAVDSFVKNNSVNLKSSVESTSNGIEIKGCENTTVENNTLSNGAYVGGKGVFLTYPANLNLPDKNVSVSNNIIKNFPRNGIYIHYAENSTVSNNVILQSGQDGIYLQKTVNVSVNNNTIFESGNNGILVNDSASDNKITQNDISGCPSGILVKKSSSNTFENNKIYDCTVNGIYAYNTTEENSFLKNDISNCPTGVLIQKSCLNTLSENTISDTSNYGVRIYSNSQDNTVSDNIITNNKNGVVSDTSTATTIKDNSISGSSNYGVNIHAGTKSLIENNEISNCVVNPIRLNYGADNVSVIGNTIDSTDKDSIYINASNDADKTVEKFITVHDNIINSPDDTPQITVGYGNMAVQAYSNLLNGVTAEGVEPKPNYMRYKGDEGKYTSLYDEMKLIELSIECFDDRNRLSWNADSDAVSYRVAKELEDGTIQLLAYTEEKAYEDILTDETRYQKVKYWVAPVTVFENVKYVGMNLTIDFEPEIPTSTVTETVTETASVTETQTQPESTEPAETE